VVRVMPVSNLTVSSMTEPMERSMSGHKWSPFTTQNEGRLRRLIYKS